MQILSIITVLICSMAIGFGIGREVTKIECGKILAQLEQEGFLQMPFDEDDEDFK